MATLREWIIRLWGTLRPGRRDAELEEELRLRYGLRALRRNPMFASVAVLTLALGIGMMTRVAGKTVSFVNARN